MLLYKSDNHRLKLAIVGSRGLPPQYGGFETLNEGIKEYLLRTYNRQSHVIEYGGDQVANVAINKGYIKKYPFLTEKYILCVARIQPDNNIEMIIKAFEGINLLGFNSPPLGAVKETTRIC
jgi:glycosyltransferase involved in cell wall biosynthesis